MSNFEYSNELFRIINGALRLDVDKVKSYSEFLAEKLKNDGEDVLARRIQTLLAEKSRQLHPVDIAQSKTIPVDSESRFPLLERVDPTLYEEEPLILLDTQWDIIQEFILIAKSESKVDLSSLSILLYGPPGTGKSRLARYIAQELGLDLYLARLDGLVSSFLGSTSKNIRALFEFSSKRPCILFLDEFDAIAKLRSDNLELGELKRVVNSFIQNLDGVGHETVIIAATNHEELLDPAIWRRFSYRIEFFYPSFTQRLEMWQQFLPKDLFSQKERLVLADLSEGFSGSDIKEVCIRLSRRKIVYTNIIELRDAFNILRNLSLGDAPETKYISNFSGQDEKSIASYLSIRNKKLYSSSIISKLIGVSKATANRHIKGDASNDRGEKKPQL
ncbi:MAG: AAA family ATPase [bacterium]|jgi:hypothetical protein